jgi:hypothetical protein
LFFAFAWKTLDRVAVCKVKKTRWRRKTKEGSSGHCARSDSWMNTLFLFELGIYAMDHNLFQPVSQTIISTDVSDLVLRHDQIA